MRHLQPFSSDFPPSGVLEFTLLSTSKPHSGSVTHILPLPELCCCVKPIHWWSVSTDSQPGVLSPTCPMLPTPLWPHYSSHASTEHFRHICTLQFLLLFHVSLLFHWQLNTQQTYINCHSNATHKLPSIYTNRKLGWEQQVITLNTAAKVNIGTWKYLVLTVGLKTSVMCLWYPMAVKETWGRV